MLVISNYTVYDNDSPLGPAAILPLVAVENRYIFYTKISNGAISVKSTTLKIK